MNLTLLSQSIAEDLDRLNQQVQRSLVVVHNGRIGAGAGPQSAGAGPRSAGAGPRSAGAGVIWRGDGYIVTNQHVVARGRPRVSLADGREFPAHIAAREKDIDLALLQIEADELPAALIGDSRKLQVGQMVLAFGHPWGQRGAVSAGIISSLGRVETRNGRGPVPVIHSDVTLAPGNSGGPLVNAAGEVIGINTLVVGGDLGVAIPSHLVDEFVRRATGERGEGWM